MTRPAAAQTTRRRGAPPHDLMRTAIGYCESGRLEYVSATQCRMRIAHTVEDDASWWYLDLEDYRLPATRVAKSCTLADDSYLGVATVLAIDAYLDTAGQEKATHKTVATVASTIAKIWEWGRLRGLYRPEDWTSAHFRLLEAALTEGRWSHALNARQRVEALLKQKPVATEIARLGKTFSVHEHTQVLLATNMSSQELSCARAAIHRYVEPEEPTEGWKDDRPPSRPTYTWLVQVFWAANLLVRVPAPYGFRITPFPDPAKRAKKLAVPNARTPTLSVDQAVALLIHSHKYVNERTDSIVALVREVGRVAHQAKQLRGGRRKKQNLAEELWRQSAITQHAEEFLGIRITLSSREMPGSDKVTVPALVDSLMTAGVIQIAGMNARRKGEITHKKLGLKRDALSIMNAELGVYEGTFYIEKTLKSYAEYFVNKATYDAFTSLKRLEEAQLEVEQLLTGRSRDAASLDHSMFWRRSFVFSRCELRPRTWFEFSLIRSGSSVRFVEEALGRDHGLKGTSAHIFRRFYAIIYLYRFEHGGLIAVRYQLAHWNCETTRQYVTDAMIQTLEARIPVEMRRAQDDVRSAIASEWAEIDAEIEKVGDEKLMQMILSLLGQTPASGGFPRIVERLHRRLTADLDYSSMDVARQAAVLHRKLKARRHSISPLPQGDCLAGSSPARAAKCSKEGKRGPSPENATASTCAACAYSWTTVGHLEGQKMDMKLLDDEIASVLPDTPLARQFAAERQNLQKAIWLHEERLL